MKDAHDSSAWTNRASLVLGQWFGSGRSPVGPGTVGSLCTLPLFWLLRSSPPALYWGVTLLVTAVGIPVSQRCATLLGDDDPSSVVIDEVAGVLIALGFVVSEPWWVIAVTWTLFRVFDIAKPGFIDRAQHFKPKGWGIMVDDVLAGLCAGACGRALVWGASVLS